MKMGSLQTFVGGYKDATIVLRKIDWSRFSPALRESFQVCRGNLPRLLLTLTAAYLLFGAVCIGGRISRC